MPNRTNMTENEKAVSILSQYEASGMPGVYVLGSYARGVSFAAQQFRALNLAWALSQQGKINRDSQCAVVGGGLAGLTCAAALIDLGFSVQVLEEADVLMPRQRNSTTRFVHPNAHLWPFGTTHSNRTSFPLMNWSAASAHDVRRQILMQWNEYETKSKSVLYGVRVARIQEFQNRPLIELDIPRYDTHAFDCVILAVGFGLDDRNNSSPYWQPDGFDYIRYNISRKILVSGTGDGGLVDLFRLRIKDFDYSTILSELMCADNLIATEAVKNAEVSAREQTDPHIRGNQLLAGYREAASLIRTNLQLREETHVHLVSPYSTPYGSQAQPINRLLLSWLLLTDTNKGLSFHQGRVEKIKNRNHKFEVTICRPEQSSKVISCDVLALRHGPQEVVSQLIPIESQNGFTSRMKSNDLEASSREPLWTEGSFSNNLAVDAKVNEIEGVLMAGSTNSVTPITFGSDIWLEGHPNVVGSLGIFVKTSEGNLACLTAAHIFDHGPEFVGKVVYSSSGNKSNRIGLIVAISKFRTDQAVSVDAALILLDPGVNAETRLPESRRLKTGLGPLRNPLQNETVYKINRNGSVSAAKVSKLNDSQITLKINEEVVRFEGSFEIEGDANFAVPGDSGSILFSEDNSPVGMIVGRRYESLQVNRSQIVALPLKPVLQSFRCKLIGHKEVRRSSSFKLDLPQLDEGASLERQTANYLVRISRENGKKSKTLISPALKGSQKKLVWITEGVNPGPKGKNISLKQDTTGLIEVGEVSNAIELNRTKEHFERLVSERYLRPGSVVQNLGGGIGAIGIFVKIGSRIGFTIASHVADPIRLSSRQIFRLSVGQQAKSGVLLGYVERASLLRRATSLTHDNEMGKFDIAVVSLEVNVEFKNTIRLSNRSKPSEVKVKGVMSREQLLSKLGQSFFFLDRFGNAEKGNLDIGALSNFPMRLGRHRHSLDNLYLLESGAIDVLPGSPVISPEGLLAGFIVGKSKKYVFFQEGASALNHLDASLLT